MSPLEREHGDVHAGHAGQPVTPDACCVDHDVAVHLGTRAVEFVEQFHTLDAALAGDHALHLVVVERHCAVQAGVEQVGYGQAERVDRRVGDAHGADDVGIDGGVELQGLGGVDGLGVDACVAARRHKGVLILQVVVGQRDEQAVGRLDAMAGNGAHDTVLCNALGSALAVGHGIARAAVHQAVVAACRPGAVVIALDEQHLEPTHGAVSRGAGAGDATTHDNHVIRSAIDIAGRHRFVSGSKNNHFWPHDSLFGRFFNLTLSTISLSSPATLYDNRLRINRIGIRVPAITAGGLYGLNGLCYRA